LKITDARVIVCSPGRNFVTLKITTEDGIYGLGDATLNGRELAVVSYLRDHVVPLLIGRDARRIEGRALPNTLSQRQGGAGRDGTLRGGFQRLAGS
jgi:L-alanine-DL-glutamate epimerase-like enolase superfamily enzyme